MEIHKFGKKGFTLIELLVVVAIMAVLVALLLPGLRAARTRAQSILCQSNLKQVVWGLIVYEQEYGIIPQYWIYPGSGTGSRGIKFYIDRVRVWGEPEKRNFAKPDSLAMTRQVKDFCRCPVGMLYDNVKDPLSPYFRWEINSYGTPDSVGIRYLDGSGFLISDKVEAPVREPCFGDSCGTPGDLQVAVVNRRYYDNNYAVSLRHTNRANMAFLDGHVESLDMQQNFNLGFAGVRPETESIPALNPQRWPKDFR